MRNTQYAIRNTQYAMGLKVGSVSTHFVSSNTQYAMALKEQLAYLVQYAIRKKAPKYAVAQYAAYTVCDTHGIEGSAVMLTNPTLRVSRSETTCLKPTGFRISTQHN